MNLRPRRLEQPEINLTPLIDIVFLLLIFFMVSTSFREETALQLALPEIAESGPSGVQTEHLVLEIDAEGRYFVAGEGLVSNSAEVLTAALRRALESGTFETERSATKGSSLREDDRPPLVIRADRESAHGDLMRALDVAGQLGLTQVRFAATTSASALPALTVGGDASFNSDSADATNNVDRNPEGAAADNDGREGSQ